MGDKKDILHLTLKRKWFDLVASGKKRFEYREFKQHWITRLCFPMGRLPHTCETMPFNEVRFVNGYGKDRPVVTCKHIKTHVYRHNTLPGNQLAPQHDEPLIEGEWYFVIELGEVLKGGVS